MGKEHGRELEAQLQLLPGFRFRPTDEELIVHYLCRKAAAQPFAVPIIAEVDLYKFDPWDLPEKALVGEKEWYFFSPRDRKYPNGSRPNRAAGSGYWKATGVDKPINTFGGSMKVGVKKALVFYTGRAPKAVKTNWIMHEYLLADNGSKAAMKKGSVRLDDWVLCRIYNKTSSAQTAFNKEEGAQAQRPHNLLASSPGMDGFKLPDHFQLNVLQGYTTMERDAKSESNSMSHDLSEEESGHASVGDESGESTLRSLLSVSSSVQQASVSAPAAPHSPPPAAAATTITTTTSAHPAPSHPLLSPLCATIPHAAAYTTTTFAGATAASRYPAQPQLSPFNSDELPSPFWRLEPLPSSFYW